MLVILPLVSGLVVGGIVDGSIDKIIYKKLFNNLIKKYDCCNFINHSRTIYYFQFFYPWYVVLLKATWLMALLTK